MATRLRIGIDGLGMWWGFEELNFGSGPVARHGSDQRLWRCRTGFRYFDEVGTSDVTWSDAPQVHSTSFHSFC